MRLCKKCKSTNKILLFGLLPNFKLSNCSNIFQLKINKIQSFRKLYVDILFHILIYADDF